MRNYLALLLKHKLLLVMMVLGLMTAGWFSLPDSVLWPRHVMLSLTGKPETLMVTWHTGRYAGLSQVEYREAKQSSSDVVSGVSEQVPTDKGLVTVHQARLTGLKPDTEYQYRVGGGFLWSPYYHFKSPAATVDNFTFLLFGDSHSNSYDVWQKVVTTAKERNPDASFMINIGDLVDIGLNYTQWQDWFQAGHGVIDSIPVMPVMGNHETYTSDWKIAAPLLYETFFHLPNNGPEGLKNKVYSYDYGPVHFSVLDSQLQEEGENIPEMLQKQQEWLKQDLAATQQPWKVVLLHRPVYHNRPSVGDEDLRDGLVPIFDTYQVDVVFAGHDHGYARSYPMTGGKWSNEQGRGTVYITTGRSGTKVFEKAQNKPWDAVFYNPLDQPNYLTVKISPHTMMVTVFKLDGNIIDAWEKSK